MRLDKYVSAALGIPRSESRKRIMRGEVLLNGAACKKPDAQISETADTVTAGGGALGESYREHLYLMLYKPKGVVSASRDARDTTVADLVRGQYPRRELFPAGRLDKTSTEFVLLTDDGPFAHALLAPGRHVPKTYLVTLDTPLTAEMRAGFAAGVPLADGTVMAPAEAEALPGDPLCVRVVLHQGVYHQIKRMFGVYGAGVNELHRQAIGGVELDAALAPGGWRELSAAELAALRAPGGG